MEKFGTSSEQRTYFSKNFCLKMKKKFISKHVEFYFRRFTNNKITPANHLSRSYQLAENNRTIRIIFPISLAHSLIFICFLSSKILLQALEDDRGDKNYIIWDELCDTVSLINFKCVNGDVCGFSMREFKDFYRLQI